MRIEFNNYYNNSVRELCHEVKDRNPDAINEMAQYFIENFQLNKDSILIPAPQHEGFAIYTKEIAERVANETGCQVLDIIKSNPRPTLYQMKLINKRMGLGFYTNQKYDLRKRNVYLVDNVFATGKTFNECRKLIGKELKPLVYGATDTSIRFDY